MRPNSRKLLALALPFAVGACGSMHIVPNRDYIANASYPAFETGAPIRILNAQESSEEQVVSSRGFTRKKMDYRLQTQAICQQLETEIERNGGRVSSDADREIRLAVTHVEVFISGMKWKTRSKLAVATSDDASRTLEVEHATAGNIFRAMSGTPVALLRHLLEDEPVRAYLAAD